jgi:hypothetical protein
MFNQLSTLMNMGHSSAMASMIGGNTDMTALIGMGSISGLPNQ